MPVIRSKHKGSWDLPRRDVS